MNENLQLAAQVGHSARVIDLADLQFDLQKQYLDQTNLSILPIENIENQVLISSISKEEMMSKVRFFAVKKFVYEKDVKIAHKLKSVFTALHSINSSFLFKLISNGKECDLYVGVKSLDRVSQKADVLKGALVGNFPGTSFLNDMPLNNNDALDLNSQIFKHSKEITAIIGTPSLKDKEEEQFIQGIENLILGMNGKAFSAVFIADPIEASEVELTLDRYEQLYSVLSSEKEFVLVEGENTSESNSVSLATSQSKSTSKTQGTNNSTTSNSSPWIGTKMLNGIFGTGSKTAIKGANILEDAVRGATLIGVGVANSVFSGQIISSFDKGEEVANNLDIKTKTEGSKTTGVNYSDTISTSDSESKTKTEGVTSGTSTSRQKTYTNKKVTNFLDRLDKQVDRLEQGKGTGFWNVGVYFMSDDEQNSVIAANIYNGIVKGAESNFETAAVKTFNSINKKEKEKVIAYLSCYEIPRIQDYGYLGQAITTDELTVQINLPHKSVIGLDVVQSIPFGNNPKSVKQGIKVGQLYNYQKCFDNEVILDYNKFTSHIFVTGSTGSGKSNVTYNLIDKLNKEGINFLVIEPAKGEYKDEFGGRKNVEVFGTNPQHTKLLRINPFEFPEQVHVYEHIDRFIEILNSCWPMEAAMPNLLKEAVELAYTDKGWYLDESICIHSKKLYPTFGDLLTSLENVINTSSFSAEVKSNYEGALVSRVKSMTNGLNKMIFVENGIPDTDLFDKNVIVDLSLVASSESKALFMGILFMKLNEYRIANKTEHNSKLKHVTVIEEAHNLLKRTSTETSSNNSNLAGKSVEMISNAIAEMRTYGEGFIIADQAPELLDMSVIRNTNTKICLRLPDFEDRKLVGQAMNLNEDQITELASLETGVAVIYQNDWQEAIQCKFEKFESKNAGLDYVDFSKQKKINQVLEIIADFNHNVNSINEEKTNFIIDTIGLDFIIKHNDLLEMRKKTYLKRRDLKRSLIAITGLVSEKVNPIQEFVVQLLRIKNVSI